MSAQATLRNCRKANEKIFHTDQQISQPTLLIKAKFETQNRFLRLTLLKRVLPITSRVSLKIFFKNLYSQDIKGVENVTMQIEYPGTLQIRPWKINLPNLKANGDCVYSETRTLFQPEVPGTHRLIIKKVEGIQYADIHGVTDRPYKQIAGDWTSSFHVLSEIEYRVYSVAFFALIISVVSLLISAVNGFCS